jgi:hypothetical protein
VTHDTPHLRFGEHTRVQRSVLLSPDVDAWVAQQARRARCSFSEMVNRLLSEQRDLRRQLAESEELPGLPPGPAWGRHADALGRAVDGLAAEVRKTRSAIDFLKAMVDRSTYELLAASGAPRDDAERRYERWITSVQRLLTGKKAPAKGEGA